MSKDLATGIGITCLAVIVCALVPMAGVIGSVFIPVPLVVFRAKLGRTAARLIALAGLGCALLLGGPLEALVGSGSGKKLATVGGAVAGGYAGNKIQEGMQQRNTYQESHRTCRTVSDSRQQPDGYDVTYRLNGSEQQMRMSYDPGQRIPVANGQLVVRP